MLAKSKPSLEALSIVRQPMVELKGVSKRYGDTVALAAVDLCVQEGEFVTLLGPSGSGKTTLLNLIAGMAQPSSGQIFLGGRDATALAPSERGLGMVFQNYALMPHMTVFENIAFPLRVRKLSSKEIEHKVNEALKLIRLPQIGQRKPRELSGGQQQRVSLARCIVYNPSLILLDEPLGALDRKLREQMQLEIKRIHGELGITMLNVTHDQDEALTLSDRIVLMNGGRIEQESAPEELYFRPRTVFAADFIGDANLFDAEVTAVSSENITMLVGQSIFTASSPSFGVRVRDRITLLVRPENIRLSMDSSALEANAILGEVENSIVLGGVVKHHITLADSKKAVVQEPNHVRRQPLHRGQSVQLCWNSLDSIVLPPSKAAG